MADSSKPLMLSWRFAPLFWCQFFSAFNDNFLKNAIVFLILFHMGSQGEALITLAGAVFIAPYFFLSALGGEVADRYDKAVIAQRLKLVEIGVAAIAVVGFVTHSLVILFVALAGFGVIGALFGPIKYGILPDHLERRELPAGNALVEGATFIAILLGTIAGGIAAKGGGSPAGFSALVMVFALLCWVSALLIPRTGEAAPNLIINKNIATSTWTLIQHLRSDERLWWGALVTSWFWLAGVVVLSLLPPAVKNIVGGDEYAVTAYLAVFSIAVAVGSGLAAFLASGRIILLPTLLGALLLAGFALFMGWSLYGAPPVTQVMGPAEVFRTGRGINVAIALGGLAIGGGLFIVPAFAAVQAWAGADRRARVVAAVNILNALFMTVATLVVAMLQGFAGATTPALFIGLGIANTVVAVLIAFTMPTRPFADALSIIYRAFFRAEVHGLENLQKVNQPNVILALNHVSFLDAGIALSLLGRDPLFAIDTTMAQKWWVKPFARMTRSLPIDPLKPMATRTLIQAVASGETLIIFPEGRLTMTGSLMKVYDGAGLIADKSDAVIVPIRIEGLERSYLTRLKSYQIRKQLFPKVRVTVLEPTKLNLDPTLRGKVRRRAAGAALYDIMSNMIYETTPTDRTIVDALIEAAQEHGMKTVATEDLVTGSLTYKRLLLGTRILGKKLMPLAEVGKPLGVMLPNANGAVVTIFGLMSAGRVPAMINFTAGASNILAGCRAAGIDTVVTSRAFIERGKLEPLVEKMSAEVKFVYLEDVRATVGLLDKLAGMLSYKKPLVQRKPDDWAAILFTSGSEGVPKGVVLSNRNILTNAAQARARIDFNRMDKVFNILPVFHSFGLTVGVILPIVSGVPIFLYPSPLHYRTVPELVKGLSAETIGHTEVLTGDGKHLLDGFFAFRHSIEEIQQFQAGFYDTFKERLSKSFLSFKQGVAKMAEILMQVIEEASSVKQPLNTIMEEVQHQDLIRQSAQHVMLSLSGENFPRGEGARPVEALLDEAFFVAQLPDLCTALLLDVDKRIESGMAVFGTAIAELRSQLESAEQDRKVFIEYFASADAAEGQENALESMFAESIGAMRGLLDRIEKSMLDKRKLAADGKKIVAELRTLEDKFLDFSLFVDRFRNVDIAARIELAKQEALMSKRQAMGSLTSLTHRIQADVTNALDIIHQTIRGIEKTIRQFSDEVVEEEVVVGKLGSTIRDIYEQLSSSKEFLSTSLRDFSIYTSRFFTLLTGLSTEVDGLRDLLVMTRETRDILAVMRESAEKRKSDLQARLGVVDWTIKNNKLKAMIGKFTMMTHKQSAADIGGFAIEGGSAPGELTLS